MAQRFYRMLEDFGFIGLPEWTTEARYVVIETEWAILNPSPDVEKCYHYGD